MYVFMRLMILQGFSREYNIVTVGSGGKWQRTLLYLLNVNHFPGVGKSSLTVQFIYFNFCEDSNDPTVEGRYMIISFALHHSSLDELDEDSYAKKCIIDEESALINILDTSGVEEYRFA
jgi:hypothetical protein